MPVAFIGSKISFAVYICLGIVCKERRIIRISAARRQDADFLQQNLSF